MLGRKSIFIMAIMFLLFCTVPAFSAEKWQGTDDLVDNQMKQVSGVSAGKPLIDISSGNLGLFVFACGGFAAGTVCGYQWRKIFSERKAPEND